jgi:hypothetical protein
MSILEQFLEDLAKAPEDWKLRGVVADWAEDNHRPELAECLRWMIRKRKRPYPGATGRATWFNAETVAPDLGDPESDIPSAVFVLLEGGQEIAHHKAFPSSRAAEESFQDAWAKARARGWAPHE